MKPVGEFTPCFLRVVARFSAHADPNTLTPKIRHSIDILARLATCYAVWYGSVLNYVCHTNHVILLSTFMTLFLSYSLIEVSK
jgi:hypothetical protein